MKPSLEPNAWTRKHTISLIYRAEYLNFRSRTILWALFAWMLSTQQSDLWWLYFCAGLSSTLAPSPPCANYVRAIKRLGPRPRQLLLSVPCVRITQRKSPFVALSFSCMFMHCACPKCGCLGMTECIHRQQHIQDSDKSCLALSRLYCNAGNQTVTQVFVAPNPRLNMSP